MSDEARRLEEAKSEALAAFASIAAIIDLAGEAGADGRAPSAESLRDDAVRHLSAALTMLGLRGGVKG
jgi:hypothetical protein